MKYTFTTTDSTEVQSMLKATKLQVQIDSLYDEIFRPKLKYIDSTPEEYGRYSQLWEEVREHFEGCFSE